MYEEEDPDYGQGVSLLYAAYAQDAALTHQQWMHHQRIIVDQGTGKFIINFPTMQNAPAASSSTPSEPLPFFAYQPGTQPSSKLIRSNQLPMMHGNVTGQHQISVESMSPSNSPSLGQIYTAFGQFNRFQQLELLQQSDPSPGPLFPSLANASGQSYQHPSFTMFQDQSTPHPTQPHLFTYPSPDINRYNITYNNNPNFSPKLMQNSTSELVLQSSMPLSPKVTRSLSTLQGTPTSPQYNQGGITGEQLRSLSGQALKRPTRQFSQPPASMRLAM
jgi:hypothetical protein